MGLRAADLGLGPVDPQGHALRIGVGEHVGQHWQAQSGLVGDGEAAVGEQRTDLADCLGDGGGADPVQLGERGVRELSAQVDQSDQHPVGEHQLMLAARPGGTAEDRSSPAAEPVSTSGPQPHSSSPDLQ